MDNRRPTWAEINLEAVRHNVRGVKKLLGAKTRLMSVVKANGYGHGDLPVAQAALSAGADCLGVATLNEAIGLREAGIKAEILLLGYAMPKYFADALYYRIELTIFSYEDALLLSAAAKTLGKTALVHVKINTGMNRLGLDGADTAAIIAEIAKLPNIRLKGIFTHFFAADQSDLTIAKSQLKRFLSLLMELDRRKIHIPVKHCANSAAAVMMPESHMDMVRAGIVCYGLHPSSEVDCTELKLRPAMQLKSRIVQLREVSAGETIGYGGSYRVDAPAVIATVPIGYADGYARLLSNRAWAVLKGKKIPLVGKVCMDQATFDVTRIPEVKILDEVVLFGAPEVTADDLGEWMGTINYEIVCMVSSRVPRLYLEE